MPKKRNTKRRTHNEESRPIAIRMFDSEIQTVNASVKELGFANRNQLVVEALREYLSNRGIAINVVQRDEKISQQITELNKQ